jgi:hypothetical protein
VKKEPGQRFDDCVSCKFFKPLRHRDYVARPSGICLRCGAGEFFEERFDDFEPSDQEKMNLYFETEEPEDADE